MQKFTREEYNKLCAKLLKWEETSTGGFICPESNCDLDYDSYYRGISSNLRFDSDWNWIHEIIEKIESLKYGFDCFKYFDCNEHHVEIRTVEDDGAWTSNFIVDLSRKDKKEAVVNAIWQFLIWYYENNKDV